MAALSGLNVAPPRVASIHAEPIDQSSLFEGEFEMDSSRNINQSRSEALSGSPCRSCNSACCSAPAIVVWRYDDDDDGEGGGDERNNVQYAMARM